jgi:hypothetical protein
MMDKDPIYKSYNIGYKPRVSDFFRCRRPTLILAGLLLIIVIYTTIPIYINRLDSADPATIDDVPAGLDAQEKILYQKLNGTFY